MKKKTGGTKRKMREISLTVTVDRERVGRKTLAKLILVAISWQFVVFNIGLFAAALGAKMVFGYALLTSFTQWIGLNLLGLGVKWIYNMLFKKDTAPSLSEEVKAKLSKFEDETKNSIVKNIEKEMQDLEAVPEEDKGKEEKN